MASVHRYDGTRYAADLRFRAAVDEQLRLADAAALPDAWIIYAIHDPSRPDTIGGAVDGLIVYIGQTKLFGKRVRKHLRNGGRATTRPRDRVEGGCYDIMARGFVPRFSVRETCRSAIDALIAETNLARRMIALGCPLLNRWPEQRAAGPDIHRRQVRHAWLWPLSVADAMGSRVGLVASHDGTSLPIDLTGFPSTMRLSQIRLALKERGIGSKLKVED